MTLRVSLLVITLTLPLLGQRSLTTILARTDIRSDVTVSQTVQVGKGAARTITLELDPQSWTDDPALTVTFVFEKSFDGGTNWEHFGGATAIGGARSKDGSLPSLGVAVKDGEALLVRAVITATKNSTIGLKGVVE